MCGASSYRPVIQRDSRGAMRPSGMFQCSGCSFVFSNPKDWHRGGRSGLLAAPLPESRHASREGASATPAAGALPD